MRNTIFVIVLMLCGSVCGVQSTDGSTKFSRVTVKGHLFEVEPKWHVKVYEDAHYQFVFRHYGNAEFVPGFFVYDLKRICWLEITELSTEHARLGRSPDFNDIPLMVGWNFRDLAKNKYAQLPLRTPGSIIFPDQVAFDSGTELYRLDCNSQLKRDISLTSFWVRKADLGAIDRAPAK